MTSELEQTSAPAAPPPQGGARAILEEGSVEHGYMCEYRWHKSQDCTCGAIEREWDRRMDEIEQREASAYVHAVARVLADQHGVPVAFCGSGRYGNEGWFIEPAAPIGPGPDEQDGWLIEWTDRDGWTTGRVTTFGTHARDRSRVSRRGRPDVDQIAGQLARVITAP